MRRLEAVLGLFVLCACVPRDTDAEATESTGNTIEVAETETETETAMSDEAKRDQEWREKLTPEQYHVAREKGTERAFTGKYWDHKEAGSYTCVCCDQALFSSESKFKSGTGWPSFYQPIADGSVKSESDDSLFMNRTEVLCSSCDAHLGHVFDDGPEPTGLRFCVNSASLDFKADAGE